jgi:hypothetical protein
MPYISFTIFKKNIASIKKSSWSRRVGKNKKTAVEPRRQSWSTELDAWPYGENKILGKKV